VTVNLFKVKWLEVQAEDHIFKPRTLFKGALYFLLMGEEFYLG
jgi:hypothetical protein